MKVREGKGRQRLRDGSLTFKAFSEYPLTLTLVNHPLPLHRTIASTTSLQSPCILLLAQPRRLSAAVSSGDVAGEDGILEFQRGLLLPLFHMKGPFISSEQVVRRVYMYQETTDVDVGANDVKG
ncbi:hypothetical protein L1887_16261 [Cichorium endivia]|nr:hypothetical protein L1887_16261 [Cichorium endivia]